MKNLTSIILILLFLSRVNGQPLSESIVTKYNFAKSNEDKERLLYNYLNNVVKYESNSIDKGLEIQAYFNKQKDENGSDITGIFIADKFTSRDDYTAGLNMALHILANFEKRKDNFGIAKSQQVIASCFDAAQNFDVAIEYLKKTIPFALERNDKEMLSYVYNYIGAIFAKAFIPDSGLVYAQKAVTIDSELKDESRLVYSVSTLAENYIANKDYDLAMPFLKRALKYGRSNNKWYGIAYIYNDFAQAYKGLNQLDSSNNYTYKAISLSISKDYKDQLLRSYQYLYQNFDLVKKQDSINKYFRLAMTMKDSLYSLEKMKNMQTLSFREQLRQKEIESEKIKAEEERKQNIQFSLTALGIITFIIIFMLLSRSMITNTKVIEFLGVMALLIVFEFLNLLLHPYLDTLTHHTPVLMLIVLVCIAALLVPAHHALEKWTTKKLVEKNKKIRLENAKRTIEKLES